MNPFLAYKQLIGYSNITYFRQFYYDWSTDALSLECIFSQAHGEAYFRINPGEFAIRGSYVDLIITVIMFLLYKYHIE